MSAEILQLFAEVFNRDDLDDAVEYLDPEVELRPGVLAPDQDALFRGPDGVREFLRGAIEPWESVRIDRKEIVEAPGNRFVAVDRWYFRGRDGIEIERELPTVFTFEGGRVVRIDGYTDRAEALKAVGLEG